MTKTTLTHASIFLVLTVACTSLDLGPKDQLSDASFWKTPDQFQSAANDFYFGLQGAGNYTEVNSDIAFGTAQGSSESYPSAVSNGSYLPPANSKLWDTSYAGIRGANYLLKKAALKYFPEEMVYRKKEGFLMPVTEWLSGELEGYVRETLSDERLGRHGIFNQARVRELVDDLYCQKSDYRQVNKVFALVVFQEWYDLYMR